MNKHETLLAGFYTEKFGENGIGIVRQLLRLPG